MTAPVIERTPYCRWVIAKDYNDGAVSGVGLRAYDEQPVLFRVVAWDSEQWERVFAVTEASRVLTTQLEEALTKSEPRRVPFWLPGPQSVTAESMATWGDIFASSLLVGTWQLVRGHDLLDTVAETPLPSESTKVVSDMVRRGDVMDLESVELLAELLQRLSASAS
jgi:hypothetical protein